MCVNGLFTTGTSLSSSSHLKAPSIGVVSVVKDGTRDDLGDDSREGVASSTLLAACLLRLTERVMGAKRVFTLGFIATLLRGDLLLPDSPFDSRAVTISPSSTGFTRRGLLGQLGACS